MNLHSNARLTPHLRLLLCRRVLHENWRVTDAAESLGVSRATAYKWLWRYEEEGEAAIDSICEAHPQHVRVLDGEVQDGLRRKPSLERLRRGGNRQRNRFSGSRTRSASPGSRRDVWR